MGFRNNSVAKCISGTWKQPSAGKVCLLPTLEELEDRATAAKATPSENQPPLPPRRLKSVCLSTGTHPSPPALCDGSHLGGPGASAGDEGGSHVWDGAGPKGRGTALLSDDDACRRSSVLRERASPSRSPGAVRQ